MNTGTVRTLYRGTNSSGLLIEGGIAPGCLFAASDIGTAMLYGDRIEHIGVRPEARILVEGTAEFARVAKRRRGSLLRVLRYGENLVSAASAAVASARDAGYDAVEFNSMKDMGIAIINESAFVRDMAPLRDEVTLSGRKVVLYHGCASFDEVSSVGLLFDRNRSNDFGEGGYLASCGGTYFSDSIEIAAFYAANANMSEANLGGDPCVFAVEIDEALLIADEDKVWDIARHIIETLSGKRFDGCDLEHAEAEEAADAFLARHGEEALRRIRDKFLLKGIGCDDSTIRDGLRAFIVRALSYEWNPADVACGQDLAAINGFCAAASRTISRRWLSEHYETASLTCRTLHPVAPAGTPSTSPARIVGHVRLQMDTSGLSIRAVDFEGHFDENDAIEFEESFIEKVEERSGCEITSEAWADTAEFC